MVLKPGCRPRVCPRSEVFKWKCTVLLCIYCDISHHFNAPNSIVFFSTTVSLFITVVVTLPNLFLGVCLVNIYHLT